MDVKKQLKSRLHTDIFTLIVIFTLTSALVWTVYSTPTINSKTICIVLTAIVCIVTLLILLVFIYEISITINKQLAIKVINSSILTFLILDARFIGLIKEYHKIS